MGKTSKIRINLLICTIILLGFAAVGFANYRSYSGIIKEDIGNISKLTTTNIYAQIRNELARPIVVSLTMANDSFLKAWLLAESHGNFAEAHQDKLTEYLAELKSQYGYDIAFVVSENSRRYYYHGGLNKVVSRKNEHDDWYYQFLNKDKPYDLDIDTDEVNQDQLTVFINCRITDESGKLMGVTGVGLRLNRVQALLQSFEEQFGLKTALFNKEGVVQVSTDTDEIYSANVFDIPTLGANRQDILAHRELRSFAYQDDRSGGYMITQYIEDMDWFLLVIKETSVLRRTQNAQMVNDLIIFALVVVCVLFIVDRLIRRNEQRLSAMAKTDPLTGLCNRRGFNDALNDALAASRGKPFYLFIFDIDDFKEINDTYGHLAGDQIIVRVGRLAREAFADASVARWGGDEFAGFCVGEREEVLTLVNNFFDLVRVDEELKSYCVTVCFGITECKAGDSANTLLFRADRALYQAKDSGKDRYEMIE
ncbi:MAG TPA: diguanylate cyclase [Feifaniaceae bacterium]|nr:diguanylate cyclase [Feifaniaceae bacterium]